MKKRMIKAIVSSVIAAAMALSICQTGSVPHAAKKASLKTRKLTIEKGKTKIISIKNRNRKNTYTFKVDRKKIATVSKKGVVKGLKVGKAVITVRENYRSGRKTKSRKLGKVNVNIVSARNNNNNAGSGDKGAVNSPAVAPTQTPAAAPTDAPAPTQAQATAVNHIYVAANGSDTTGNGSQASPFGTIERAKEEVRKLSRTEDIVVEIADGFYPVSKTIEFTSADSGNDSCTIYYKAAAGAHPVISGGTRLSGTWTEADEVNWLEGGLKAYKIPLVRNKKLRAIYVNGERAEMTSGKVNPVRSGERVYVERGQADWAWASSTQEIYDGTVFPAGSILADTLNPQNIELDSSSTWARQIVCVDKIEPLSDGNLYVSFQMPYGMLAQNLGWGTAYGPTKENTVTNVFEWLGKEGQFYFDQAGSMLYYIPREGEDINSLDVVIPELETIVSMTGDEPLESYVQNIVFDGITFAYSDWNLYELENSHGYASVQGSIVLKAFADVNQHNDIYRSYDVPESAIRLNSTRDVKFINGEIRHTGNIGIHIENDVNDIDVTGNYIGKTSGAGIVVGHPTHVYENDGPEHHVTPNNAGPDMEKFTDGTESVPKNITITNNYLLENCYFFSGHSPITTFYTYNLQVLHNFIYRCSYSGMSIGWGWCNFDGYNGSDSQLPGYPTTTSKNNHINYNRVEEICSLLADAGGIYTLGQQGNDDWTEYSEMSFNYINAKRIPPVADGSKWVNGFHPDEGSAYIKFDSNVITNIIKNTYELNDWRRKHDMIVTNSFTNTNKLECTAPECTVDQYYNADAIWPQKGYETVLYSGLEDEYVYMVGKDVIPDTDYELAANVRLTAGEKLKRRGLLAAGDTVWLAPEGTVSFVEGDNMVKAAGNVKEMDIPSVAGEYKLYIVYADGRVSDASTFTLYIGEDTSAANVKDGADYSISKKKPFVLSLETDNYTFTLNNKSVSDGETITTEGRWTLKAEPKDGGSAVTILFTTSINKANKLISDDRNVSAGEFVKFDEPLYDAGKIIWLADTGVSAFDKNDPAQSSVTGDRDGITAPSKPGTYRLTITDVNKNIDSYSDAYVIVK